MADRRIKAAGRRTAGVFCPLPYSVINHPNFQNLSPIGCKLIMELCSQLRMKEGGPCNNGDLCVAWKILSQKGWTSKGSISRAIDELKYYGFALMTRAGSIKRPALYALTFFAVDDCKGKLDCAATKTPLDYWREVKPKYEKNSCAPEKGRKQNNRPDFRSIAEPAGAKIAATDPNLGRTTKISDPEQGPFLDSTKGVRGNDAVTLSTTTLQ